MTGSIPLRPDQASALEKLRVSLEDNHRRPIIQAPTGYGKTRLAAAIAETTLAADRRMIFVVPMLSLIEQTADAFFALGITDVGIIQGNHPQKALYRPIQIASAQTLARRAIPQAHFVVIDECHKLFKSVVKWMAEPGWQAVPFIGLSATPWTRGLGKFYDDLIIAATTAELIEAGLLSPFRAFAPTIPDLTGVRTVAGDWHEGDLAKAMGKGTLTADIVQMWMQHGEDRPTLVFGVDRAHAQMLQRQFESAGVTTAYVDAFTDRMERENIRLQFHAGDVRVVCSVGTLTHGIDWDVRCIVLARPTKSRMLYVQIIGRGLRTAPGKTDCLVLDHSNSTRRLGFVTDICQEHLDDGQERVASKREADGPTLPKPCPSCSYLRPAGQHVCPNCGFAPVKQSDIVPEKGELIELTPRKRTDSREERQRWYSGLLHIATQRGYAPGWAVHKYKEKFGSLPWADGLDKIHAPPARDILNWEWSRRIAWAKSRGRA